MPFSQEGTRNSSGNSWAAIGTIHNRRVIGSEFFRDTSL